MEKIIEKILERINEFDYKTMNNTEIGTIIYLLEKIKYLQKDENDFSNKIIETINKYGTKIGNSINKKEEKINE